jgi:prepilin-type processing-associated H-X9-DG protein
MGVTGSNDPVFGTVGGMNLALQSGLNTQAPPCNGVLFFRSAVRFGDISDGSSNTLMIGERPPPATFKYGWWFAGGGFDDSGVGDVLLSARSNQYAASITDANGNSLNCSPNLLGLQPGSLNVPCDQVHFWSLHSGGAGFIFCDGSVHFLPYSANSILPQLATIAGNDPVNFDF